jgi:hypothetical protein
VETNLTEFEVSIIVGEPGKWVADSMVTALSEALESEGFRVASIQRPPSITEEERNLRNLSIPLNNNLGCSAIVARPLTSSTCIGDESSCPCDEETMGQAYRPLLVQSVFHAFVGDLPNFAQEVLSEGNYHHVAPGIFQGGAEAGNRFCIESHPKKGRRILILRTHESPCEDFVNGFFSALADSCPALMYVVPFDQFVDDSPGVGESDQSSSALAKNFFIIDDALDTVLSCSISTAIAIANLYKSSPRLPLIILYGLDLEVSALLDDGLITVAVDPVLHSRGRGVVEKVVDLMKIRRWTHCRSAHKGDPPARGLLPVQISTETLIHSRTAEEDVVRKVLDGYSRLSPPRLSSLDLTLELDDFVISDISTRGGELDVLFVLKVNWKDPRLEFDPFLIRAYSDEMSNVVLQATDIWTPLIQLSGVPQIYFDSLVKLTAVAVEGVRLRSDGSCSWQILYRASFGCTLNIDAYPFDDHECTIPYVSTVRSFKMVQYHEGGTTSGFEFEINVPDNDGAMRSEWKVRLYRKGWHSHVAITVPSHLLVLLSFTSFWLPPTGVFDRAGLLITTILAAISLQQLVDFGLFTFQGTLMSMHIIFHFAAFGITVSSVTLEHRVQEMHKRRDEKISGTLNKLRVSKEAALIQRRSTSRKPASTKGLSLSTIARRLSKETENAGTPSESMADFSPRSSPGKLRSLEDEEDTGGKKNDGPDKAKSDGVPGAAGNFWSSLREASLKFFIGFWGSLEDTTKADLTGRRVVLPMYGFFTLCVYFGFDYSPWNQSNFFRELKQPSSIGLPDGIVARLWFLMDPVLSSTILVSLFYCIAVVEAIAINRLEKTRPEKDQKGSGFSAVLSQLTPLHPDRLAGGGQANEEPTRGADTTSAVARPETSSKTPGGNPLASDAIAPEGHSSVKDPDQESSESHIEV